jgi:hypothetical protein
MLTFAGTTPQDPHFVEIDTLIQARADLIREARSLPRGAERNNHRRLARYFKTRIDDTPMRTR